MTATVRLTGVGKDYGRTHALRGVDLVLEPGVTGLLGPNGAGKTSLLRILATVLPPTAGRLQVLDLDPADPKQRTEVRRRLGYLPQELGFPSGFTAFAFVDYLAVLKEWTDTSARHEEVRRVLDLVDLAGLAAKKVKALSGGQRRRLALAQALLGSPALMLLDEPTTGLDPEQRASLRAMLAEVARTATVLLSTHQTEDVAALCERVVVLDAGSVCFDGTVDELLRRADGCVWLADEPHPAAVSTWRTAGGRYRNLLDPAPRGAELVEPTLEDAYLLLRRDAPALT
jgi:ABC-2 type transport system ATP-binding protein